MEYTPLSIYERLNAGESEDFIAKEIADNLNKEIEDYYNAVVKQKSDQYANALNEAIAMKKNGNKEKDAAAVTKVVNEFVHKWYGDLIPKDENLESKDLIGLLDTAVQVTHKLESIFDEITPSKKATTTRQEVSPDAIQQFLKNAGLL